jgi:hypothetical protein
MNDLMGTTATVGRSFSEVADTGSLVAQQMGTTGQETKDLTAMILEFSRVTGTDATTAVTGLDDAMDAWGLQTSDAGEILDTVTAGVQQFGGTASDSMALLNSLAPALQAAGMSWQDAAGMINLFNRAGVDANVTATAFNKALQKVKSPEELQQLISDIGATEDPFQRAQKAADLFGAKAGPKLALALSDSKGDLSAFKLSAEDVAGTVAQAGEDMLTTGDKIKMFADKTGAVLRGLGQDFGPLATGLLSITTLAAPFARSLGGMLAGLASNAVVALGSTTLGTAIGVAVIEAQALAQSAQGAITRLAGSILSTQIPMAAAGTTVGSAIGAAMVAGAVLGVGALLTIKWLEAVNEAKTAVQNNPNAVTPQDMFQGRAPMWAAAKLQVAKEMQTLGTAALEAFNAEWDRGIGAGMSPSDPALLAAAKAAGKAAGTTAGTTAATATGDAASKEGTKVWPAVTDDWVGAAETAMANRDGPLNRAGERLAGDVTGPMKAKLMADAAAAGAAASSSLAGSILDNREGPKEAWKRYLDDLKNAWDPMSEIAWINGKLTGKKLADGLNSTDPLKREAAQRTYNALKQRLDDLGALGYDTGQDTGQGVSEGVRDSTAAAARAAAALASRVNNAMLAMVRKYTVAVAGNFGGEHGFSGGGRASGGYTPAGWAGWVGEHGKEWMQLAGRPGYVVPHDRISQLDEAGGGATYNVPITIYGDADPATLRGAVRDGIVDATGLHFGLRHAGGLRYRTAP